jgi:D-inositol-3-phosphate glycosyltransferase
MVEPGRWARNPGGYAQVLRYAPRVARVRGFGSRRDVLRNTLIYRRFLAEVHADLVHVQHPLERCVYTRLVRRFERWQLPLVVTAHSLFGEHDEATIYGLMAPNLRAADRVIAVSEHIAEQAAELGVEARRLRVIRSGVDTERFRPRERLGARQRLDVPLDAAVVLFVGNLEPRKQVDVLLRAIARARLEVANLVFLVIGSGESAGALDQTARLQRLTSELGLVEVVRYLGRVDEARLLDAYAAADCFALASSSEAQGIVALEAMACGLTVVATAVGGLLGTIQDGETGFLVTSGDVAELADRLVRVLTDAARREAIGEAARRAVESRFSWSRASQATADVYREALACR